MNTFTLKIWRGNPEHQYWEEFELPRHTGLNVISALMAIQKNPINKKGEKTTPVAWEQGCLEEVCGSCSMLVNGSPRQSCTALVENILRDTQKDTITLAPLTKFPLVRDLCVDRTQMFEALKKVKAWITIDSTNDTGQFGPVISQDVQEALYVLSTCMTCGCCSESCPQVNDRSDYMGPAAMSQARLFNANPIGALEKSDRLEAVLSNEGIAGCGNAQNCARVCPKRIPLTESLSVIGREATRRSLQKFFGVADQNK